GSHTQPAARRLPAPAVPAHGRRPPAQPAHPPRPPAGRLLPRRERLRSGCRGPCRRRTRRQRPLPGPPVLPLRHQDGRQRQHRPRLSLALRRSQPGSGCAARPSRVPEDAVMTPPAVSDTSPSMPFVAAFGCFSLLFAASMLGGLASDDLDFLRTHATAWSMALLATPAMYLFVSRWRRETLDDWWRLFWTFGWLMNL